MSNQKHSESDMAMTIEELLEDLAAFDPADLAAGVGALQLLPANADHLLRLERLAGVVAALAAAKPGDRPQLSAGRWRSLINSPPIADEALVSAEDPFEEPFVDSVIFFGGNYRVMPGLATGSARIARRIADAVFQIEPPMEAAFESECGRLTQAVLWLSELVMERAGLTRGLGPMPGKGEPAIVPEAGRFSELKAAVRFGWRELDELLDADLSETLRSIAIPLGRLPPPRVDEEPGDHVVVTPIVDLGESLVVMVPTALLASTRHQVIVAAQRRGVVDDLAERHREAVERNVMRSLWMMKFSPLDLGVPGCPADFNEQFFRFDREKVAHLLVVTDPLIDYDAGRAFGRWQDDDLSSRIENRIVSVRDTVRETRGPSTGVLHIVVLDGIGRWVVAGLTDAATADRARPITLTSEDLEIIARLEVGDPLALWKFAHAADTLRERTRVLHFSTLDEYALYRDHDHSFYMGDDRRPNLLSIEPAYALQLRLDDVNGFDAHGVVDSSGTRTVHVQRRFERTTVPIYATDPLGDSIAFLVEGLPLDVWVIPDRTPTAEYRGIYFELSEAVAYWTWQAGAVVEAALVDLTSSVPRVVVKICVTEGASWFDDRVLTDAKDWLRVQLPSTDVVELTFSPSTHAALAGPDNVGERQLVRELLRAIAIDVAGRTTFDVESAVDRVAPLGIKKKILILGGAGNPELLPGPLPNARIVDSAETSFRLDDLGEWLEDRIEVGVVHAGDRVQVLNDVVEYYFSRLVALIDDLSSEGLLEFLIRQNEALVREDAERRLTLPTRIACFGVDEHVREDLEERLPAIAVTAIANRFLIEYVAATPPTGTKSTNLEVYDELLSLAAEIANKGYLSDAIHFQLADPQLSLLESGRLGISRGDLFQNALTQLRGVRARGEIAEAHAHFARHWRDPSDRGDPPDYLKELDFAFRAEFGLSTTEIAHFLGTVENIGLRRTDEPKCMRRSEFVATVCDELRWSTRAVEAALDLVSLVPRSSFIGPGPASEVFPWRFGRNDSYVRRPIIQRPSADDIEVLWGNRHLSRAGPYLLDLCLTGRLKASTQEMRQFIGRIRSTEPERFNDDVAEVFEARSEFIVRRRVKKIGSRRLARASGEPLGDVDVLVVDPRRRRVVGVETKDFEVARTPAEFSNEIDKLAGGSKAAATIHRERVDWLQAHLLDVLAWLDVPSGRGKWRADGVIVVSRELVTPLLTTVGMPVVPFADVAKQPSLIFEG